MKAKLIQTEMNAQNKRIESQGWLGWFRSKDMATAAAWNGSEARNATMRMIDGARLAGHLDQQTSVDAILQHVAIVCFRAGLACAGRSRQPLSST